MSDLISRDDAIRAVHEEFDEVCVWDESGLTTANEVESILDGLPSAEPKTKCIAQIRIDRDDIEDLVNEKVNEIVDKMSEPKTGKWIVEETDEYKRTYCSVCGLSAPFECVSDDYYGRKFHGETRKTDFCPHCGADMRGDKHE